VTAVEYPELGGPKVEGKYSFRVEWEMGAGEENQFYQYDLDVGAGTGMVWRLDAATQSQALESAACTQIIVERSGARPSWVPVGGAHSMGVILVIGWEVEVYWLGEAEAGTGKGRFRMWDGGGEVWGDWIGRAMP
jgi:hypothetical protein